MGGARHFENLIDKFLRNIWLYVLKFKRDCFKKFKEFKGLMETPSEHKIKTFQLDNGGESVSKVFNQCF